MTAGSSRTVDPGRRALLFGRPKAPPPIRPPWADPAALTGLCTRCGACADACPVRIVAPGDGGFPAVRFAAGECSFCGACAAACPQPAIFDTGRRAWPHIATIGAACLSSAGVFCRSCQDACPESALRFRPLPGGRAEAQVDAAACTGCGACVSACPVDAVAMTPAPEEPHAG